MSIREHVLKQVVFPAADVLRGRSLVRTMAELEQSQWWTREQLIDLQSRLLQKLIAHAFRTVPYYRELMKARSLTPSDFRTPADLSKLPLLTREDVRANYFNGRLLAERTARRGLKQGRTGGSTTGEPLFFTFDRSTMDYGRAVFYRGSSWAGCPAGTPMLRLWGQSIARQSIGQAMKEGVQRFASGTTHINAFQLDDSLLEKCGRLLATGTVKFIYAYASSLKEVCRYLQSHDVKPKGVRAAMVTAEVLLTEDRQLIQDTLGAPVFNGYGCGEVNGIAYECDRHAGMHVGMERAIVEAVDEDGVAVGPGQRGRLAVTDLHNAAMPFVRYLNGDEAELDTAKCLCGRALDRVQRILGRTCDIIDGVNGNHVHSYYFASLFGYLGWAKEFGLAQFQIVQETKEQLQMRLVVRDHPSPAAEQQLRARLTESLGAMDVHIRYSSALDPAASGKLRWTINKLRVGM